MQAFLYLNLTTSAETLYHQPVLEQLKQQLPAVAILDLDAQSDELMLHYAKRLLQEATQSIICVKSDEREAGFGKLMPLLENVLQPHPSCLLLLLGEHARLQRMLQVRPELQFKQVQDEEEVLKEASSFFKEE